MGKEKYSILIVEDDANLGLVVQDYIEMIGYQVTLERDGEAGLIAFKKGSFDLCILDVMMPKMDGFSLALEIRKADEHIPILFLSAKALKDDRIRGFKVGADDYVTKPFSTEELGLRIHAILKRSTKTAKTLDRKETPIYQVGKYRFDFMNLSLDYNGNSQHLTRKEADLLKLFYENKNQVLTREFALKSVWGDDDYFIGRSMDVFITRLRKYLKDDPSVAIVNVHGTGFKFVIENKEL